MNEEQTGVCSEPVRGGSQAADPHTESQEAASTGIGVFGGQRADTGCRMPGLRPHS